MNDPVWQPSRENDDMRRTGAALQGESKKRDSESVIWSRGKERHHHAGYCHLPLPSLLPPPISNFWLACLALILGSISHLAMPLTTQIPSTGMHSRTRSLVVPAQICMVTQLSGLDEMRDGEESAEHDADAADDHVGDAEERILLPPFTVRVLIIMDFVPPYSVTLKSV